MERHILHCDLDSFFVSVARLMNPDLVGKPVLIGGTSGRGVVASCSYEARRFGIHSAMPMSLARQLCPEASIVKGDFQEFFKYSDMVTEVIESAAPVVEKASIDEHYLDITGMDRFFGCWKWARELRATIIRETGLPISLALSENKTVSKIATGEAKPCGEKQVPIGSEKNFLAPLSIKKIPMVGEKSYGTLRNMGISKIATLQNMDPFLMRKILGENGVLIWKKSLGKDDSPVVPFTQQKSMSKEHTFQQDTIDVDFLRRCILQMVDELAYDLRFQGRLTGCISLKIRYSNFDTHTKQLTLPFTNSDKMLSKKALELFDKIFERRMLIRLVGVRFSKLIAGGYQINLFDDDEQDLNLMAAMDKIRSRFGSDKVMKANCLLQQNIA